MRVAQPGLRHLQVKYTRGLAGIFLHVLGLCLLGYAYLGKGFAYIGIPPFYVDSVLIFISGLYLLLHPGSFLSKKDPLLISLLLFMGWGAIRTLPYISIYGIDALRDSVIWSYGIVALVLGYLTWKTPLELLVTRWYLSRMGWLPFWAPFAFLLYGLYRETLPRFPWGPLGGIPIVYPKGGDVGVHLAGILSYRLFVWPYCCAGGLQRRLFWLAWLVSFGFVAFTGRGAFLAVAFVAFILAFHASLAQRIRVVALVIFFVLTMWLFGLEIDIGMPRKVSVDQFVKNVASIFTYVEDFKGEGTKQWRLMWWNEIINYTFWGPYFWTGKGFGINLADDDGFQVAPDRSLRSPHNAHMTVLARAGVPGFALWMLFLALLMSRLWLSYWRWRFRGERSQAGLRLWTFSYLLAAIINATFDVFLEGPMGGIWFWSIVGFGIGLLLKERGFTRGEGFKKTSQRGD
ncbi:MAG: O-antigen ligase family protein [Candidatus Bathyarchaeia archaeon]